MPITINGSGTIGGLNAGGLPNSTVTENTLSSSAIAFLAPSGAIAFVCQNTAPTGWLKANGAAVSRTAYATLFGAIGTTFGSGDGSTTFNLPDFRGEFPRALDDGRGIDSGRTLGTAQSSANLSHNHGGSTAALNFGAMWTEYSGGSGNRSVQYSFYGTVSNNLGNHSHSISSDGGSESRPRNIALLAVIKY